ncbi:TPA: DNA polymerase III, subunit gamma and tau, partial [bacterium]|nr:DNA polymerase III, subunit gamma and tau [bacterium]
IDEIRDLREKVKFLPANSRHKIYIIDEVHMLTEPAFNALLKTLEEPPAHIIFIFATTDPHRIPPTILSRTQRFSFRRIPPSVITEALVKLIEQEGIEVEKGVLSLIARSSEGSLRDSQGMLDQLIAYSGEGKITTEEAFEVLGIVKQERLKGFTRIIAQQDARGALKLVEEFVDQGGDLFQLVSSLVGFFRDLFMVTSLGKETESLVDLSKEEIDDLKREGEGFGPSEIIGIIEELVKLSQEMKQSSYPRLLLEISLIRLSKRRESPQLEEIYKEIMALESRLKGEVMPSPSSPEFHHLEIIPQLDIEEVRSAWPKIIREIKKRKPSLGSCLEQGELMEVENGAVFIGFKQDSIFQRESCEKAQELIRKEMKGILGQDLKIKTILLKQEEGGPMKVPHPEREDDLDTLLEMEPMVKKALEIFEGKIFRDRTAETG